MLRKEYIEKKILYWMGYIGVENVIGIKIIRSLILFGG